MSCCRCWRGQSLLNDMDMALKSNMTLAAQWFRWRWCLCWHFYGEVIGTLLCDLHGKMQHADNLYLHEAIISELLYIWTCLLPSFQGYVLRSVQVLIPQGTNGPLSGFMRTHLNLLEEKVTPKPSCRLCFLSKRGHLTVSTVAFALCQHWWFCLYLLIIFGNQSFKQA